MQHRVQGGLLDVSRSRRKESRKCTEVMDLFVSNDPIVVVVVVVVFERTKGAWAGYDWLVQFTSVLLNLNQADNANHQLTSCVSCLSPPSSFQNTDIGEWYKSGRRFTRDLRLHNRNPNRLSSMLVNMTLRHMNLTGSGAEEAQVGRLVFGRIE